MRYEVQFKSSGIVAFSASDRGICQHWMDCNDYSPDIFVPNVDPDTGEITSESASASDGMWLKGECLGLFVLRKVK
jgi:hypothetical protein